MSGTLNTQASEFPQDPSILTTGTTNADEFRDVDLVDTAVQHKADFSSVPNETMARPVDGDAVRIAERRLYANGPEVSSVANVSDQGARRYGAFTVNLAVGENGYPGSAVLLLGADRSRVRTVISNAMIDETYVVGPLDQVGTGSGFLVPPNTTFETTVTEPLYACIPATGTVPVAVGVWAEYA